MARAPAASMRPGPRYSAAVRVSLLFVLAATIVLKRREASGSLDAEDYDDFVRDTVNFLVYISEPIRGERRVIGTWVMIYLLVFLVIAAMLKKQIWKDVK